MVERREARSQRARAFPVPARPRSTPRQHQGEERVASLDDDRTRSDADSTNRL